jgi:hypothetical protein
VKKILRVARAYFVPEAIYKAFGKPPDAKVEAKKQDDDPF